MKEIDSEPLKKTFQIDIENVVYHLFQAYPNVNYIALNPALKTSNVETWEDHWYFIGFDEEPVYKNLDGAPAWVARPDIMFSEDEWGLFYMHISSQDHYYRGVKIQNSRYDFASPRFFCWQRLDDGTIQQLVTDELDEPSDLEQNSENLREFLEKGLMRPLEDFLRKGVRQTPSGQNGNND